MDNCYDLELINNKIDVFKEYVQDDSNSLNRIMNKYLLYGIPYIFESNEDIYFQLKEEISEHFGIQQTQIFVVGSAKLGFSIAPHKLFKHVNEDSDVDVAIICDSLFDYFWKETYKYNITIVSRNEEEDRNYRMFLDYLYKGWVRPDYLPCHMRKEWFEFFKKLYGKYERKIAAGIYRDNEFFMDYHRTNLKRIRRELCNEL